MLKHVRATGKSNSQAGGVFITPYYYKSLCIHRALLFTASQDAPDHDETGGVVLLHRPFIFLHPKGTARRRRL